MLDIRDIADSQGHRPSRTQGYRRSAKRAAPHRDIAPATPPPPPRIRDIRRPGVPSQRPPFPPGVSSSSRSVHGGDDAGNHGSPAITMPSPRISKVNAVGRLPISDRRIRRVQHR